MHDRPWRGNSQRSLNSGAGVDALRSLHILERLFGSAVRHFVGRIKREQSDRRRKAKIRAKADRNAAARLDLGKAHPINEDEFFSGAS